MTGDPLSGQPAGVGSRTAATAGVGIVSTNMQTTAKRASRRYLWSARMLAVFGYRVESCGPSGNLWMRRRRPLAFVDRLTCAGLPSGLTSHAWLPASGPGDTFGLDFDREEHRRVRVARASGSAERFGAETTERRRAAAGKEGTRPWPSSPHDSSSRAASTSDTRLAVGIQR
jgi:hypothetical protein